MKKTLVLFTLVFLCINSIHAQDSIYNAVNKQTCACLTAKASEPVGIKRYHDCITEALQHNMKAILIEIKKKHPDSTNYYQQGAAYGQQVGSRLDTDLVYSCDAYFKIADTIRASVFRIRNQDSLRQVLVTLNGPTNVKNASFYQQRGITYFLLGMTEEANKDAEEVLKQHPTSVAALLIHAIYLEANNQYSYAAELFYQLDKITGDHAYLVSAAINNRKNRELSQRK